MHGFQLWANLPAALKMTTPRYQDVSASDIPSITDDDGTHVRVVCGEFWGKRGPVEGIAADPSYLDVSVPPNARKTLPVDVTRHAFAYVFAGSGTFRDASAPRPVLTDNTGTSTDDNAVYNDARDRSLIVFDRGDEVTVQAGPEGIRFLLVSGKPLEEPVAWHGPIVMNTNAELRQAMADLRNGHVHQVAARAGVLPEQRDEPRQEGERPAGEVPREVRDSRASPASRSRR